MEAVSLDPLPHTVHVIRAETEAPGKTLIGRLPHAEPPQPDENQQAEEQLDGMVDHPVPGPKSYDHPNVPRDPRGKGQ